MHHDHNAAAKLYKNAKHIVQVTEWNMLHNPPVAQRGVVNPEYVEGLDFVFVNGDVYNLFPGISLMYTPGHSAGGQSIVVDTEMGRVIICGICSEELNFDPPKQVKQIWPDVLVPGMHTDCQLAYESMARIKSEADYIVTLHDRKTYDRGICPSPKWSRISTIKS
jgi:hypothetical protein